MQANTFHQTADHVEKAGLGTAAIMNNAFAIELYLKCLLTASGITYKKTHLLNQLFRELPDAHKNALKEGWGKDGVTVIGALRAYSAPKSDQEYRDIFNKITARRKSFEECLDESAEAFKRFRYFHEYDDVQTYSLSELLPILGRHVAKHVDLTGVAHVYQTKK
jgi:hypothetical protein